MLRRTPARGDTGTRLEDAHVGRGSTALSASAASPKRKFQGDKRPPNRNNRLAPQLADRLPHRRKTGPLSSRNRHSRCNHGLTPDLRLASQCRATPSAPTRTAARHDPHYLPHRSRTGSFSPSRPSRNLRNLPDNPTLGPLTFAGQSAYDGMVRGGAPHRNPKAASAPRFSSIRSIRSILLDSGSRAPR